MILYFERKADKDGKRRMEVTVEEFEVQAGKRYLYTRFWKGLWKEKFGPERHEAVRENREDCLRYAIESFDEGCRLIWPEES